MEFLGTFVDVIILIAAFLVAITNIYKFFSNSKKGIKKQVDKAREEQEKEFNEAVDARVKLVVKPMLEQQAATLTASFETLLDKHLPNRLNLHDQETRQKYLADRHRYLCEIKDEVVEAMKDKIQAVETHEGQMNVFTIVLQELLRERIMEIYRRNKHNRQLEEHERFELNKAYTSYKSIDGNSYIDDYFNRMKEWATVPDED